MKRQVVRTTLEEDFKALGISIGEDAPSGSQEQDENVSVDEPIDPEGEGVSAQDLGESEEDLLESDTVNNLLFDRIEGLPHESLKAEDYGELLKGLSDKKVPDEMVERAEKVVAMLQEGAAKRQRRFKSGSTARKMSFQCPPGQRAMGGGGGRPVCRPSHQVAGGVGKLNRESRKKKKWSKSGSGKVSARKSDRASTRRQHFREDGVMSPLAMELVQVTESNESNEQMGVRDEIISRITNIFDLLNEEFCDKSVTGIFEDQVNSLLDSYEHDRLEEDSMDDGEFIIELDPALKLITKSFGKIEEMEESGNE